MALLSLQRFVLLACTALLTVSCSRPENVQAGALKTSDVPAVAVAKATLEDLSQELILTAEFKPFQEVEVMAKVAGYVKQIHVDVGDRVKQGQLLAVLEIPEMADDRARAQAAMERSQAEVARAKDELQRTQSAHDIAHVSFTRLSEVSKKRPGLVAQQEIDDAQSKDLVAEAQIAAAKSNQSAAEQQVHVNNAELQKVNTLSDYARMTAPFAGVITKRYADTGSMIQAGTASNTQAMPLVRLSENSLLRLILPVPESAVPTVRIGQQVDVRVSALNRSFRGQVARFTNKVALATRTMDTEVDVPNPSLVLIPGMYAEVNLSLEKRNRVLTVPIPAIDIGSDESSGQVVVVNAENQVEIRTVRLGLQTAAKMEIRSGLHEGDLVVTGNRASLHAGDRVRPKLTEAAP